MGGATEYDWPQNLGLDFSHMESIYLSLGHGDTKLNCLFVYMFRHLLHLVRWPKKYQGEASLREKCLITKTFESDFCVA